MGFAKSLIGEGLSFADVVETGSNTPESLNDDAVSFSTRPRVDGPGLELSFNPFKSCNGVDPEADAMKFNLGSTVVDTTALECGLGGWARRNKAVFV